MTKRNIFCALCLLACCWSLSGCTTRPAYGECSYRVKTGECAIERRWVEDADLLELMYAAADHLLIPLPAELRKESIITTTVADINQLRSSSALGRLLGEHLSARFTQRGHPVIEARLRHDLLVEDANGEFMLSRELQAISREHESKLVSVGTYAVGSDTIYITVRLVAVDGQVLSARQITLPLGPNTFVLLNEPA